MASLMPNISNRTTYHQVLDVLKQQRMIWFGVAFAIDVYDTYLHQYPSPDPTTVELEEPGGFAKYEDFFGRLCWMGLSYGAWGLLLKKNIEKAKNKEPLTRFEIGCVAGIVGGWVLRMWCKYLMGKRYTYSIIVYRGHEIMANGPYRYVRHPGMLGMMINLGGTYAWLHHWWGYLVYLLVARDTYVQICDEERCLGELLGERHEDYVQAVPAKMIPFLW
mmetsp:Transcript_25576/g.40656  ORF Transcript_25576/g.40656 Transcript_25576/m.40656 type:complete len:219 (-) Transcript_25576:136-792(-)|eukprot:CAMPEP_0197033372 /NCGR_PEP_ID=MMETSP1384-20130603/11804_1 /TAXON_ID=29189 /ORGANISM="Ammonia sp." /LENGTH=218 /DNA_ID=CAMNT_0042463175 /DNA_START=26 /DNA_END=682 /DNA_ORIENTATION=-